MSRVHLILIFPVLIFSLVSGKPSKLTERLSHLIFPGTNWCGLGNIAKNYDDLGPERTVDSCCRTHDSCPEEIDSGETNFGLYNKYFIARLHCKCDKDLYYCLKNTTSPIADLIGNIYFNVLQYPCFAGKCPENYVLPWGECTRGKNSTKNIWYDTQRF